MTTVKFQDPHAADRRVLRAFWDSNPQALDQYRAVLWDENGRLQVDPPLLQPGFEHMTCGARTRRGTPCAARRLWPPSYRCEMHGGLSWRPHGARDTRACAGDAGDAEADAAVDGSAP